jgi:putative ABC transport system permease protein
VRILAGFAGALVEAWTELRIHRTRVLLSLVGVGIAIAALTLVAALGGMVQQSQTETFERQGGRPAMLSVSAYNPETGQSPDPQVLDSAFAAATERYQIQYTSRMAYNNWQVQLPGGVTDVQIQAVDPDYGTMHRVQLAHGSWFTDRDELRLAPAVVINEAMWKQLGSPPLATHPTIPLPGDRPATGVVIGVTPSAEWDTYPTMYVLWNAYAERMTPEDLQMWGPPLYEAWVPPELADQLSDLLRADIAGSLGEGWQTDVSRNDYLAWGGDYDPLLPLKLMVGGVAALVLLLGALGLLTISLVTVRYRIREIGIRRSFGATGGRVFFSVMMESVVATLVAGGVGVLAAVLLSRLDIVREYLLQGAQDTPAFPWEAVVIGLVASTVVGALAGLMPALIAVRVKVIDAIRL